MKVWISGCFLEKTKARKKYDQNEFRGNSDYKAKNDSQRIQVCWTGWRKFDLFLVLFARPQGPGT